MGWTTADTCCPQRSDGSPTTTASATRGWALKDRLDFLRIDLLPSGVDAERTAAEEADRPVRVDRGHVTRKRPSPAVELDEGLGRFHRVVVVTDRNVTGCGEATYLAGSRRRPERGPRRPRRSHPPSARSAETPTASGPRCPIATAWTGDSEEPTASLMARTLGSISRRPSLTSPDRMLPPEPKSRSDDVRRDLPRVRSSWSNGRRSCHRPRSASSPARDRPGRARETCPSGAVDRGRTYRPRGGAECGPLPAGMHQRTEGQRDELVRPRIIGREKRSSPGFRGSNGRSLRSARVE